MGEEGHITAYQLKIIAVIAMTVDHIAWMFVPGITFIGQLMHTVGRITAPIMCFLVAEGCIHTRNMNRYMARMGIAAIISAVAFNFYKTGSIFKVDSLGMIYTLFLAVAAIRVYDNGRITGRYKIIIMAVIALLSIIGDWPVLGVLWPLMFYIYRNDRALQVKMFSYTALVFAVLSNMTWAYSNPKYPYAEMFHLGLLLAVPLLKEYNGRLGGNKCGKWFFYVYYPVHLVLIRIVAIFT